MFFIVPYSIFQYRRKPTPNILFPIIKDDEISMNLQKNLSTLELEKSTNDKLKVLMLDWNQLKNSFEFPPNITPYSIFYLRFGYTIGIIDNPNLEELNFFYQECNNVSKNIVGDFSTNQATNKLPIPASIKDFAHSKMKIYSKECPVYQFRKTVKPKKGKSKNVLIF